MGDAARSRVEQKSKVTPRVGRYVGNDGFMALVDLGDQRVPVQFATPWVPEINEPVWVDSVDGVLRLIGPTVPKPGLGVVVTVSGSTASVATDFGDYVMPVAPSDPMPSSGDTVRIVWSQGPSCSLLVDVPDPTPPPPPPGDGGGGVKTAEFRAVAAGSTDRGSTRYWTSEVYASNSTYGVFAYGSQIKDTIPAGAEFVSLEVYVNWRQKQGGAPRWVLHNQFGLNAVPAVSGYTEWSPGGGWQTPPDPAGWFHALKGGGGWAGVGLDRGGYNILHSLAADGLSGALRIRWR